MAQFRAYVGNIPFSASEADLRVLFDGLDVRDVKIINDRESGKPRGFAFVEFGSAEALGEAIGRDGESMGGRKIVVNEARPQEPRGERKGGKRDRGAGSHGRGDERDPYADSWREGKRR